MYGLLFRCRGMVLAKAPSSIGVVLTTALCSTSIDATPFKHALGWLAACH